MQPKPRVLVGLSGGVDSSVSAALLLEQGYEVVGGFMKNWSDGTEDESCGWRAERRDAMRVAAQLGIPFHTFDFEEEYRRKVYEYMIAEYRAGRTPNPDVRCNKYMKFDLFLREADALGCAFVATGHYARVKDGRLYAGVDTNKDQSYFLCQLTQEQLRRVIFPIGEYTKPEVRERARKFALPVAEKKDSQGICFVGKVDMVDFLAERIAPHEGNIVTTDGKVLGTHKGFAFYTIGQREGLGVGGGTPLYVVERRPETNEVVVAVGDEDPALYRSALVATDLTETVPGNLTDAQNKKIAARIRYRQPLAPCVVYPLAPMNGGSQEGAKSPSIHGGGSGVVVTFDTPQRAVAPGQFIAFYDGDELIGSGVIAA
ncbi:tRNA 2-thiouridine(34) synthase MnmA [Candidatus Uhrbacteria bacterium]|nr:tRNA 2-thiouridine(34) synthase MnmA [Candidatus Uhrbacteria bacterium]